MATNTTTTLNNQYQRYFNKVLLETAQHTLVYNQFGAKRQLPRGVGAKDIRFFRRVAANSADVQTLVEGTPISVFKDVTYTPVDATLAQIGEAAKYTDLVGWTLLDVLDDGIDLLGEDCALKADDITQGVCMHPTTGLTKRYTGVTQTFAGISALTGTTGKYVSDDGLAAVTQLRINRAPKKNGVYIGTRSASRLQLETRHGVDQCLDLLSRKTALPGRDRRVGRDQVCGAHEPVGRVLDRGNPRHRDSDHLVERLHRQRRLWRCGTLGQRPQQSPDHDQQQA